MGGERGPYRSEAGGLHATLLTSGVVIAFRFRANHRSRFAPLSGLARAEIWCSARCFTISSDHIWVCILFMHLDVQQTVHTLSGQTTR
jgi:hypothetical protein